MSRIDAAIFALLVIAAALLGASYAGAARRSGNLPPVPGFNQHVFGAALMEACGYGLTTPTEPPMVLPDTPATHRALIEFLSLRRETLSCAEIPADVRRDGLDGMQRASRYLLWTVALTLRLAGTTWVGVDRLLGVLFGISVGLMYLVGRTAMGRAASMLVTLFFMFSPLQLVNVPDLRDYAKAPFFIATLLVVCLIVLKRHRPGVLVALAAEAGAMLGFGFGMRTDIAVNLLLVLAAVTIFLPERPKDSWKTRMVAAAACLAAFAAVAAPIVSSRESGSNIWHWALLGSARDFDNALDIAPAPYETGHFYSDSYVATIVDAYWSRATGTSSQVAVGFADYPAASRGYYTHLLATFPADALLRGWAAVIKILDLPFGGVRGLPHGVLPAGVERLTEARNRLLEGLAGFGVVLFVSIVLAVSARSARLATLMFGAVAFLGAYPAVQFQRRHIFHLEVLSLLTLGLAVSALVSLAWRVLRGRTLPPTMMDVRARTLVRPAIAALGVLAIVVIPLTVLRSRQQQSATTLLDTYERARVESLSMAGEPVDEGLVRLGADPARWPRARQARSMHSHMLVADVSAEGCDTDEIGLTFSYAANSKEFDFSEAFEVTVPSVGRTRIFFPVFETGATSPDPDLFRFAGLDVARSEQACVKQFGRFVAPDQFALLLPAILPPDWRDLPLHQTLRGWEPSPRYNGSLATYWAPAGLRARRSVVLRRLAEAASTVGAAVLYRAPIARIASDSSVIVDGMADGPGSYLVAWHERPMAAPTLAVAEGSLVLGGLTIGLVDATGWVSRLDIDTPGKFRAVLAAPRPGRYQLVVANHLRDTSLHNRFTVARIGILDGQHD